MKKMWKAIPILFTSAVLVGCASIMGKSANETLNIRSTPDQATVVILDESGTKIFEGKTPTSLPLVKKKGYFSGKKYSVNIKKEGFAEQIITVDTTVNAWYIAGNLVFGGAVGWLIIDPATGAMWKLDTNEINVALQASRQSKAVEPNTARIVLLEDVPLSFRSRMIKISQ